MCVVISVMTTAQTRAPRRTSGNSGATVIFAVSQNEGEAQLEPIVVINRGRYAQPPVGGLNPKESAQAVRNEKRFIADYFRAGREYRLLFGGGEAGSLNVKNYIEPGCVGMTASATVQTPVKLGGEVLALATDSATLGRGKGMRRAPTEQERARALELARNALKSNRVAASRISKMETNNLTAMDLNGDGKDELIGSFSIKGEWGIESSLFLIAEPSGGGFKPALSWYHYGSEAEVQFRRLVDAVDLDGDGVAEVIAGGSYYESNDYLIYKKVGGRWRVVYQGGGGGC